MQELSKITLSNLGETKNMQLAKIIKEVVENKSFSNKENLKGCSNYTDWGAYSDWGAYYDVAV